jgi:hypothetical protein
LAEANRGVARAAGAGFARGRSSRKCFLDIEQFNPPIIARVYSAWLSRGVDRLKCEKGAALSRHPSLA